MYYISGDWKSRIRCNRPRMKMSVGLHSLWSFRAESISSPFSASKGCLIPQLHCPSSSFKHIAPTSSISGPLTDNTCNSWFIVMLTYSQVSGIRTKTCFGGHYSGKALTSDVETVVAVHWLLCSLAYVSGRQAGCPPGFPNWPLHVTAAVTLEPMIMYCRC